MKTLQQISLIIFTLSFSFISSVQAGFISAADINSFTASCTATAINVTVEGGDSFQVSITNNRTSTTFSSPIINFAGASTTTNVTINHSAIAFEAGDTVTITLDVFFGASTVASDSTTFTSTCEQADDNDDAPSIPMGTSMNVPSPCDDGRININLCEPVAIYPIFSDEGVHMVVYNTERGDDIGEFAFFVDAEILNNVTRDDNFTIELGRSEDNFAVLNWTVDNHYQVVAGPDYEGKFFIFEFAEFPFEIPTITTIDVN